MNLTLLEDDATEPVSLPEAKSYLELADDDTLKDDLVQSLITASRVMAETYCGRQFASKRWRLAMDRFPFPTDSWIRVPYSSSMLYSDVLALQVTVMPACIVLLDPLVSVQEFRYKKSDGTTVVMVANTDYLVDTLKRPGIVTLPPNGSWPNASLWPTSAVQIDFTSGPSEGGYVVPQSVRQAMKLLINQWFESRIPFETIRFVAELPYSVSALLQSERLFKF